MGSLREIVLRNLIPSPRIQLVLPLCISSYSSTRQYAADMPRFANRCPNICHSSKHTAVSSFWVDTMIRPALFSFPPVYENCDSLHRVTEFRTADNQDTVLLSFPKPSSIQCRRDRGGMRKTKWNRSARRRRRADALKQREAVRRTHKQQETSKKSKRRVPFKSPKQAYRVFRFIEHRQRLRQQAPPKR